MEDVKEIQRRLHPPMVEGNHTFATATDRISDITLKRKTPFGWFIGFGIGFIVLQIMMITVTYLVLPASEFSEPINRLVGHFRLSTLFGGLGLDTREL